MSARIDSVYYFDYTREVGFYDSIRNFTSLEMKYIGMAISTERVRVNSTPTIKIIDQMASEAIREYVISNLGSLVEISKELAVNSPKYFLIKYADDSERYFKFDEEMLCVFEIATSKTESNDSNEEKFESPYAIKKSDEIKTQQNESISKEQEETESPYTIQKGNTYLAATHTSSATYNYTQKSNDDDEIPWEKMIIGGLLIFLFIVFILFVSGTTSETPNTSGGNTTTNSGTNYKPVSEPASGQILSGSEYYNGSKLTITAASSESCVVKLKTSSGTERLSFYVRAGDTVTVGVPSEYLYIYFASGDTWYGTFYLFGEDTSYSMDDDIIDFVQYTWEYTLYPVSNGNFSETPIDASDF